MVTQNYAAVQADTENCPWCGSVISRQRFIEITDGIRAQEEAKRKQFEANLTLHLQKQHAATLEREKKGILEASSVEWTKKLTAVSADRDATTAKLKELEARQKSVRDDAHAEAQKAADLVLQQAQVQQQKEILDIRGIFEKERDDALIKKQAEFTREKEALQKKILEMDRQVKNMTANQIGDGAEIDLFEALKAEFPGDLITRIKKGQPGADINHEVLHHGQNCGRIIYDSKNRQDWKNAYATKLREDQVQAEAGHALLCTTVFPSGKKELCVESDVIVVNPSRAVRLVSILRQAIVKMHVCGLSMKERQKKTDKLYKYIISDEFNRCSRYAIQLNDQLLELDVQEKKSHDVVWKKRGTLLTRQASSLGEIESAIAAIIENPERDEAPAA